MGKISAWQIIILVVIILVIFGSARLPQVAESLGKSLKIFKREVKELREDGTPPPTPTGELPSTGASAATPPSQPSPQAAPERAPGQVDPDNPNRSL